jgi:tetratricopeptide (TPR) repeat protein
MEDCMQESGSTNRGPDQSIQQGKNGASNAKSAGQPPRSAAPAGPKRATDPVVRALTLAILGVIVLWLVGIISAMLFGLLTPAQAPRTETESQLLTLSTIAQSGKATPQTYAQYVGVLIDAGQYGKAQQALDEALKTAKTDKSYLYAQQARLALQRHDYQGTITAADQAMTQAQAELKAFEDANVANNRRRLAGAVIPDSFGTAALAKAQALLATKDYTNAIAVLNVYLKQSPTDSDVLVLRGQTEIQVGDTKAAEADFRAALKYIPDYQPALDGLKKIGAAQ